MSDEQEQMAKSLAKKLRAREKLTPAERELLDSSDTIMAIVIQELSSANGSKHGHSSISPKGASLSASEREAAKRALAHGKAVLAREFPGVFADAEELKSPSLSSSTPILPALSPPKP